MHDPATFSAPQIFDPDRFSAERAEDKQPNRFIPMAGPPGTATAAPASG
jgi:cytochrome P450